MEGLIEKIIMAGLGAISLTREKAEQIVKELVERGEIAKEEQPEVVKKILKKSKARREEIEKLIRNVLDKMNIPTKSDIKSLNDRIERLEKEIKKISKV